MPLHLVGETIDKVRSHYHAGTGKLVQLMRGVYVDATDDPETTVFRHAVRIARYLYPRTYLSAASAMLLAPSPDGVLYLSGRRGERTRIGSLEIVQNIAPARPSVRSTTVVDSLGEFRIDVSSLRQRLLESFRPRSGHAASINSAMRDAMATRLIDEHHGHKEASDAVWELARENGWQKEAEAVERFLVRGPARSQAM
jgi:serine/threonine-protein kinase HipA